MNRSRRLLILSTVLAVLPLLSLCGTSYAGGPRQYYSGWEHHGHYHYRHYYYKPTEDYVGYKTQYVVYYPSHPHHVYYYNPYKRRFWGRCDAYGDGTASYSMLPPEYQKPSLAEIPEKAFPPPGDLPPIPDSHDGSKLDLPPDDTPAAGDLAQPGARGPAPPGGGIPGGGAPGGPQQPTP
jgi:hypothetical protein